MPFDASPHPNLPTEATISLLRRVESLLSSPTRWTKGNLRTGHWWYRYCAVGALAHVAAKYHFTEYETGVVRIALDRVAIRHGYPTIIALNDWDETTHSQLISTVREALSDLESHHAVIAR